MNKLQSAISLLNIEAQVVWLWYYGLLKQNCFPLRLETKSTPESLKTWFAIHNETGNIWTHLLSAIYYIYVLAQVALTTEENHKAWDKFFLALQAFGGIVVFGCSTGFHTMENHCSSQKWYVLYDLQLRDIVNVLKLCPPSVMNLALNVVRFGFLFEVK